MSTSPYLELPKRSEEEVRRDRWLGGDKLSNQLAKWKREDARNTDALGNRTFYTVWMEADGSMTDAWTMETQLIQSKDDVLRAINEAHPFKVRCIFQHDYDTARQDVTEDFAIIAKQKWIEDGHTLGVDTLPDFVWRHLPASEDSGYRGPHVDHAAE
jgi:hypothetical protein